MNDTKKPRNTAGWSGLCKVALVGAATLRGKELKETLEEHNFPAIDFVLLDDEESLGTLESVADEVTFVQSVTRANFEGVDIAFIASDEATAQKEWVFAADAGCAIVDLSYALESNGAPVRSPWIDREFGSNGSSDTK